MSSIKVLVTILIAVSLIASICNAGDSPTISIKSMNWLIGTWTGQGKRGMIGERWIIKDSLTFNGEGFRVNGADTVITERTQMIQCDSGLFFVADVAENKTKVWFRLTSVDSLGFLFENTKHDFPTKVCYRNMGNDSLSAWIEGSAGDKTKRMSYTYSRKK